MKSRTAMALVTLSTLALAADPRPLPAPRQSGGAPLLDALKQRRTSREFAARPLPEPVLSNLLWAAYGINRADGRRTAPSAHNRQTIDVYVLVADGAYRFQAQGHALLPVAAGDHRAAAGTQDFVASAPVNLVYVLDQTRAEGGAELYSAIEAGAISQNVYLFCASEGLATVVRGSVDQAALAKVLHLSPSQKVLAAQTVGYPR